MLMMISALFLLRLFHITDPPIEVSHNWRQTTSLMVARNFHQLDNNILYPTIDETGEHRGVVGMEFPAVPYLIHLVSIPLGYDHWYGRLITLLIVSIGSWYFFALLRLYVNERTASVATIAFCFSSLFHLGRKVMPDPTSLSLILIALFYGFTFLKQGSWWRLLCYMLFAALGALIKIPFGLFLALLAIPFFEKTTTNKARLSLALASVPVLFVIWWWYFDWNMHLAERFGQWYNSGKPIGQGATELWQHAGAVFERFYFSAFHSYILGSAAIIGWGFLLYRRDKLTVWTSIVLLPFVVVYMLKSGSLFSHHGYYALVVLPIMAFVLALFLDKLPRKWSLTILMVGALEALANQQHDFFIKPQAFNKLQLEQIAEAVSERSDLVGLVSNANPNEFYFLNRKGWLIDPNENSEEHLHGLFERGCKYVFIPRERYTTALPFNMVFENEHYVVFALN
jgi:hypothetical protein